MRHLVAGLLLTGTVTVVAARIGASGAGVAAGVAGLLATAVEAASVGLLRPALEPPYERLLKRWAFGLALRLGGLALVVVAVLGWPTAFPVAPTAAGFLTVLIPLLLGEMWLVWTNLRTKR